MQKITLLLIVLFFSANSFARTVVRGIVKDGNTGEPIIGASIYVKEQQSERTTSGLDGSFELSLGYSRTKAWTLLCEYLGYKPFAATIESGNCTEIEIVLQPDENVLDEVVVAERNRGHSDAAALLLERKSVNVVNVMSARAIELAHDQTVANIVRRMSGVTVERNNTGEGQYAILRGMDKRYNYTLVNGVKIPSPDNKNRFVPLDIFPADLLDRLEVHKSMTADLEGDGIGGAINVVMKDAPSAPMFSANLQTGYNALFFDNDFTSFPRSKIERRSPNEIYGLEHSVGINDFTTSNLRMTQSVALPDMTGGIAYGNRFFSNRLGMMLAGSFQNISRGKESELHYQPGDTYTGVTRRFYSEQLMRLGAHAKFDYRAAVGHKLSLYGGYMDLRSAQVRDAVNPEWETTRLRWNRQYIFSTVLSGEHSFLDNRALTFDWSATASKAFNQTPDNAEIGLTTAVNGAQTVTRWGTTRRWEHNSDRDFAGYASLGYHWAFDGNRTLDATVGGMFRDKKRDSFFNEYFFSPSDDAPSQMKGRDWNTFDEISWKVRRAGNLSDPLNYDASEQIAAGYVSAKYVANRFELTAGVRVEHTLQGYYLKFATAGARNEGEQNYTDVLPDFHAKYELHRDGNLHLSYYRALNRPSFFEIVPYNVINEDYKERGNPDLKHTVADNLDLRYEYFPSASEQFMVGVFYKHIKDPIEYGFDTSGQDLYFTPNNYGTAQNFGVEVDVAKYFRNFGIKANYTFTHSFITTTKTQVVENPNKPGTTMTQDIDQTRPLSGQAGHVANLSLLYRDTRHGWEGQIACNYTGKRLSEVSKFYNDDIWEDGFFQLDCSIEKTFGKFCVFAKGENLLNSKFVRYVEGNSRNENLSQKIQRYKDGILEREERSGQTVIIGVRFKL